MVKIIQFKQKNKTKNEMQKLSIDNFIGKLANFFDEEILNSKSVLEKLLINDYNGENAKTIDTYIQYIFNIDKLRNNILNMIYAEL